MANLKRKKQIEERVIKLLEKSKDNTFYLKDLADSVPIGKHEYRYLVEVVNNLKREGKIVLRSRQYGSRSQPESKTTIKGTFDAGSLVRGYSYAFVISEKGDIFIDSEDISNAYNGDEVLIEIKYRRKGLLYGKVKEVIKRAFSHLSGDLNSYQGRHFFVPDLAKIHTTFEVSDLNGAAVNDKVLLEITDWGNRDLNTTPKGRVIEIIGKAGNTGTEEISLIKQFELPLSFSDTVLEEANGLPLDISESEIKRRKDFRDLPTFTIDPKTAKDYDDAISLVIKDSKYILYVHIADVSYYVSTDSELFNESVKRGNSFYFPRTVVPMLPERISNKICSLRPAEDKLTMTVITEFNKDFRVLKQSLCESVIRSSARLNYEEVDSFFAGKEHGIPEEIAGSLSVLRRISAHLSKERHAKGYIPFNMPDTVFEFSEEGKISDIIRTRETESHKLIENFMLLANEYTAHLLSSKAKSLIFRVHEFPEESSVEKILKLLTYYRIRYKKNLKTQKLIQQLLKAMPNDDYHRVFDPMILRSMKKARYDTDPIGHFGLAMEHYTHFTSPIRRICDLTIHHLIRQTLMNAKGKQSLNSRRLINIAETASEREIFADTAERETAYRFKKLYMHERIGDMFRALVVNINNNNIIVELDELPVTGVIPINSLDEDFSFYSRYMELIGRNTNRTIRLLDRLTVRLERIDFDMKFSLLD